MREEVKNYQEEIPNQFWSVLMGQLSLLINWPQKYLTKSISYS